MSFYSSFEGNDYMISCQKGLSFVSSDSISLLVTSSFLGYISLQFMS